MESKAKQITQKQWVEKESGELTKVLITHMIKNGLTLQVLEDACENIKKLYYTDATLKAGVNQP